MTARMKNQKAHQRRSVLGRVGYGQCERPGVPAFERWRFKKRKKGIIHAGMRQKKRNQKGKWTPSYMGPAILLYYSVWAERLNHCSLMTLPGKKKWCHSRCFPTISWQRTPALTLVIWGVAVNTGRFKPKESGTGEAFGARNWVF